ncbi:MAG: transcriptional repressor [Clostridia bacterium]|nr:transcriptional repressor [Clostridia bacterium]
MTKQKRVILDIIEESPLHLNAEQIYMEAKKRLPQIAMGTVYRNLKLMSEAGEIRHISMPDGGDRYDRNVMPHEHIECIECGLLYDLPDYDVCDFLQRRTDMRVLSCELSVKGLCPDCIKKKKEN